MTGKTHVVTKRVEREMLASQMKSGILDVFATPALAALMEQAASELLQNELEAGQTSVGTALSLEHLAATPVGAAVQAIATVTAVEGRRVEFSITARDRHGEIGTAAHTRVIVDSARFQEKTIAKQAEHKQTRAVVFDMDGTLLDTLPGLAQVTNKALALNGQPEHTLEGIKQYISAGLNFSIPNLCMESERENHALHEKIISDIRGMRKQEAREQAEHFDGMPQLVTQLRERDIACIVLTNKPEQLAQRIADYYFPGQFAHVFGAAATGYEGGGALKPDPAAMQRVYDATGFASDELLYIGDSDIDMITAQTAGVFSVGVLWGFCDASVLLETGADVLVEHPLEIMEFVV